MEYLTDKDYEIAKGNGISHQAAYNRFYIYGYSRERAVTEPIKDQYKWGYEKWKDHCQRLGISPALFRARRRSGWGPRKSATTPIISTAERSKAASEINRRHPKEYLELAISNGLSRACFYQRVRNGMPYEEAATKPKQTKGGRHRVKEA
jgi:hypothetical protein